MSLVQNTGKIHHNADPFTPSVSSWERPSRRRIADETVRVWKRFRHSPRGLLSGSVYLWKLTIHVSLRAGVETVRQMRAVQVLLRVSRKTWRAKRGCKPYFSVTILHCTWVAKKTVTTSPLGLAKSCQGIRHKRNYPRLRWFLPFHITTLMTLSRWQKNQSMGTLSWTF